jgi:hypothetical protein
MRVMIYALPLILLAAAAGGAPVSCDPVLAAMFTPVRPHVGRYEVCTASEPLGEASDALEALDAFGAAGTYDRARLARLYGGIRARVTHSWSRTSGEFISITRISPYPDATLSRLLPGTLEIRFILSSGL